MVRGWEIPKIWVDGTCYIIGGGSSILTQLEVPEDVIAKVRNNQLPLSSLSPYFSFLHDKHVIGVNTACFVGNWIDFLFFGDFGFFDRYRHQIAGYSGIKVSCDKRFRRNQYPVDTIHCIERDRNKPRGISRKPNYIAWNRNSGASAINFAVHLGAKKIYLLGFDMKLAGDEVSQHFNNIYRTPKQQRQYVENEKLPFHRHLKGFPSIASDAKKLGVEIINLNPDSAIKSFKKMSYKQMLENETV